MESKKHFCFKVKSVFTKHSLLVTAATLKQSKQWGGEAPTYRRLFTYTVLTIKPLSYHFFLCTSTSCDIFNLSISHKTTYKVEAD